MMKECALLLMAVLVCTINISAQSKRNRPRQITSTPPNKSVIVGKADYLKLAVLKVFSEESSDRISDIAFSPDGKFLAISGGRLSEWNLVTQVLTDYPGQVLLWNIDSGELKHLEALKSRAVSVAFSPDGRRLAAGADGQIKIWDLSNNRAKSFSDNNENFYRLAYTADGQGLVSLGHKRIVLDAQAGAVRRDLNMRDTWASKNRTVLSADGEMLVSFETKGFDSTSGKITVWNLGSGIVERNFSWKGSDFRAIALSPDGAMFATSETSGEIKLFDTNTGKLLIKLKGQQLADVISFSPNGKILAAGGGRDPVRLWELPSGRLIKILKENGTYTAYIKFSPDGRKLAIGNFSENVIIWSVPNSQ